MFAKSWRLAWAGALLAGLVLLTGGCSKDDASKTLKVGVMAGPETDVMRVAVELAKQQDVNVELVEFTDYIAPNIALSDGSIDANAMQHQPYLDAMNRDHNFTLEAVAKTFLYPIGAYSKKIQGIDMLQDNAKVAIPNDPSNEGRALIMLHQQGLITLKDPTNLEATPVDILTNPKQLQFMELDAAQLPRALDDVDLALINSNYSVQSGLLPTRDALFVEGADSPYVNLIVARADNRDDPRLQVLIEAYQSEQVENRAKELFQGGVIPGWK